MSQQARGMDLRNALVQKRCQQVAQAAAQLFAVQGYFRTTIQEISARSGISVGLIYKYFADKDDILLFALLQVIDAYRERIPCELEGVTDTLARFRVAVAAYCRVVDSMRAETVLTYRSTKSLPPDKRQIVVDKEQEANAMLAACIRDCRDKGIFRNINVELATHQIVLYAHGWALKYRHLSQFVTIDAYISEGTRSFLIGFSATGPAGEAARD